MSTRQPNFEKRGGLIVVIVQDCKTLEVLMQAYANLEAWQKTLQTREVWLWSTRRNELWPKGATSGNTMTVKEIKLDCDGDSALLLVDLPDGKSACHTGAKSCFSAVVCPKCGRQLVEGTLGDVVATGVHQQADASQPIWRCPDKGCTFYEYAV
ncbi:MAG: phosphoribosyl-AMP cyclohydrolase [Candidatus Buchananbacteria bacterium]